MKKKRDSNGFSVIEVLVVTAILGIFIAAGITTWMTQLQKGRDARRKADLDIMTKALEDYYNDHNKYPTVSMMQCGSTQLSSYLKTVPCDPATKQSYKYMATDPEDSSFSIYTVLENSNDSGIKESGCSAGCGPGIGFVSCAYNYGVNVGVNSCSSADWYVCAGNTCRNASADQGCGIGNAVCTRDARCCGLSCHSSSCP